MRAVVLFVFVFVSQALASSSQTRAIRGSILKVNQGLIDNNVAVNLSPDQANPVIVMPTVNDISVYYEGCYADQVDRDLPMQYLGSSGDIQTCAQGCQSMGYQYFGVQYGSQCFCGNNYGKYGLASEESCNMPCSDEPSTTCGGTWANSIYSMKLVYGYQGCYRDQYPNRALPYPVWAPWDPIDNGGYQHGITIEYCAEICASNNYLWAGLQTGYQCWCGNSIQFAKLSDSECNTDCTGSTEKSPEKCGGSWANSVWQAWTKSNSYRGCWTDNSARELPYQIYESNDNSVEKCINACKGAGYIFAGVQYGTQCYCGWYYGIIGPSSECNMPCPGNPTEICGGPWATSIYMTNGAPHFAV